MASGTSQVDLEAFPALDLDFSRPSTSSGKDATTPITMVKEESTLKDEEAALVALAMGTTDEEMDSITAVHGIVDHSAHFDDFSFDSYPGLTAVESPMVVDLPVSTFGNGGPDLFATSQPPSVASMPGRQDSIASITVQTSHYGGRSLAKRRDSLGGSDEGSPGSPRDGANCLEDSLSDEFGLATGIHADGTDLGGKVKGDKTDHAPAWSELKTKAGKERKRLPLACIACRRKKIRCSGEKPACKHCLRSRIPCVYKVTARKAAPRTDYMAMLDKRLKRMEERIIKIIPKNEQEGATASVTRAVVKPAIPGTLTGAGAKAGGGKKRPADEAFGPDLDHWARAPSRSKLDGPNKPSSVLVQEAEESKLLLEGGDALPPREIQEHLAEVFFENIYGQAYHILHKPSYMRKLRAGALPPVLILSVCAIAARFSTHPKLATNPNFLRGEEWAAAARDILTKRYEWPNITILTCLLILGLHEFGTCHGGRSWSFGGQAIRMAFALQLHKDLEHDPLGTGGNTQLSFIDREIRRRTMWACFLMDRFNSSGTDRPTFIREETLKIPLPIKEKNFQLDMEGPTETLTGQLLDLDASEAQRAEAKENMGVAAWMIKTISVWGRIITYLNQGGKELDPHPIGSPESEYAKLIKQAEELPDSLPESLAYTQENLHSHETENTANQFLFLHIAIQQNILFMNRFAVSSPSGHLQQDVPKTFVTKAGAKAFSAANRISELLKDAESHFITAPFTGYCTFLSATVHIFGIFSGNAAMEQTSKRNLATNVKFLSKMKRYWGMFHWMTENLREQYRTCADAARQGGSNGIASSSISNGTVTTASGEGSSATAAAAAAASSSPIFQYGDWFDRYPHGVSQTDFLDPATYKKKEKGEDAVLEQKPELHTVEEFITTLSPQSTDGGAGVPGSSASVNGIGGRGGLKRKSISGRKASFVSSRGGGDNGSGSVLEPLQTDFSHAEQQLHAAMAAATRHQQQQQAHAVAAAHQQRQHSRSFSGTSGAGGQLATSYHALSPVSPVALSQFGHHAHAHAAAAAAAAVHQRHAAQAAHAAALQQQHHHGHHHNQHAFFPADPFGLTLGAATPAAMSQLDRQLVFGAYAGTGSGGGGSVDQLSLAGWARHGGEGAGGRAESRAQQQHVLDAAFGNDSSAWFMPFNMEPPELGDLGLGGLDAFAGIFGSAGTGAGGAGGGAGGVNGGMTTPTGAGGVHRGGH